MKTLIEELKNDVLSLKGYAEIWRDSVGGWNGIISKCNNILFKISRHEASVPSTSTDLRRIRESSTHVAQPENKHCRWPMCESAAVQDQAGKDAAEALGLQPYAYDVPEKSGRGLAQQPAIKEPLTVAEQSQDSVMAAVKNIIEVKGRFHTEQAFARLVSAYNAAIAQSAGKV